MRKLIATLVAITGLLLAAWFEIKFLLLGGIFNVVEGLKANPTDAGQIVGGGIRLVLFLPMIPICLILIAGITVWVATGTFRLPKWLNKFKRSKKSSTPSQ
jgi:hypothetical protein